MSPTPIILDLIQDWSSDSAPDIFSFVPYTWNFKIMFHQFEMIWAANQHNWIDCSTKQQENGRYFKKIRLNILAFIPILPLLSSSSSPSPPAHICHVILSFLFVILFLIPGLGAMTAGLKW